MKKCITGNLTILILLFLSFFVKPEILQSQLRKWHQSKLLNTQFNKSSTYKTATITANGVSVPADFPRIIITTNDNPDTGFIFLTNRQGQHYSMILDNTGSPVWYWRTRYNHRNFKVEDNGMLTMIVRCGYGKPEGFDGNKNMGYIVLNQNYTIVDTIHAANDYWIDEHDLKMLEDGSYLLIACYDSFGVDMSQYIDGGHTNATVHWSMIQEFDSSDSLLHQWSPWDLFTIWDMVGEDQNLKASWIYFPHMNAIDIDYDGHILISSRSLNEVTKIDRNTGEIIWRLGGRNSDFKFKDDDFEGFSCQHDINVLDNGHYIVFDNGNGHSPPTSRAAEYELNFLDSTATLIWEYRNPYTPGFSSYMGNAQRLDNENTVINWAVGYLPVLTEVRPNGEVAFEMWYEDGYHCYRTYRFPWKGKALVPYLVVESHKEAVELIFNQFGDPDVDYYKIYSGASANQMSMIDTSRATIKAIINLDNQQKYYFRITSVSGGSESGFSNLDSAFTNFIEPGANMVLNGDFSKTTSYWYFIDENPASASWSVEDGVGHIKITQGGDDPVQIYLVQDGTEVLRDEAYLFEFDAWADAQRTIEAMIMKNREPYTNYSQTESVVLTATPTHYAYSFTMNDPSDFDALVIFLLGNSNSDVYIDNISLKRTTGTEVKKDPIAVPLQYQITGNYPNPFNAETTINFSVPEKSRIRIDLVNILGQFEQTLCDRIYEEGNHHIRLNGKRLSSGIYFCCMEAKEIKDGKTYLDVHKMILLK
jgi:hypothetical protein